jgi:hypothetical protein
MKGKPMKKYYVEYSQILTVMAKNWVHVAANSKEEAEEITREMLEKRIIDLDYEQTIAATDLEVKAEIAKRLPKPHRYPLPEKEKK